MIKFERLETWDDIKVVKLPDNAEELIKGRLWVIKDGDEGWLNFAFLEWHHEDDDGIGCTILMEGSGVLGFLNECRHTYWGEGGYLHYANFSYIRAALDWLEKKGFEGH